MEDISMTRPNAARSLSLLVTPLTTIALALATMSTHAAAPAQVRDLGVVAPSTAVSAVIWLKGNNDAAFDAAAAALSDSSAPTYHKWMQDSDIAAYAPSAQDVARTRVRHSLRLA
jgi:hypothetical protein